jgi:hypothetical protein
VPLIPRDRDPGRRESSSAGFAPRKLPRIEKSAP